METPKINTISALATPGRLLTLVACVVLIIAVWLVVTGFDPVFPGAKNETYQAVFLSNGQAYFGHLRSVSLSYVRLEDVHYLVTNPQSNDTTEAERSRKSQLVKLGGEVHGPLPYMLIPKRQILFWEDLDASSRIVQGIGDGQ